MNPLCAKTQMSIFKISTDDRSMYPSMYQIMYVEKTLPTLLSSVPSESVYIFRRGRTSLDEIGGAQKKAASSSIRPPNDRGFEIGTIPNKSAILLGTTAVSGINYYKLQSTKNNRDGCVNLVLDTI